MTVENGPSQVDAKRFGPRLRLLVVSVAQAIHRHLPHMCALWTDVDPDLCRISHLCRSICNVNFLPLTIPL